MHKIVGSATLSKFLFLIGKPLKSSNLFFQIIIVLWEISLTFLTW